jgi:cysteine desulfurase/selenocysteine lyase
MVDILDIRSDFPLIKNWDGVYFDNAATMQKPQAVLDVLNDYYLHFNANVHRGVHSLSARATEAYEETRSFVQQFLNASAREEIIFTRGATEAINLVAQCCGLGGVDGAGGGQSGFIGRGDRVIVTVAEHHSNFVVWQQLCLRVGASLVVVPVSRQGVLDMAALEDELKRGAKMLAIASVHNVTGVAMPLRSIVAMAHSYGALVLIDGAQSAAHVKTDVQDMNCDFYTFSGHKVCAAMGIGVLYGRRSLLERMPPYQFGGEMIQEVTVERTTFNELPYKFEAGTPSVADALTLSASLRHLQQIGFGRIAEQEHLLYTRACEVLQQIDGVEIYGLPPSALVPPLSSAATAVPSSGACVPTGSILSFNIHNISHYDIGVLLDKQGIAVRTGHHCAEPLMRHWGINGTVRISFAPYNTIEEIDRFIGALHKSVSMLR